MAAAKRTTEKDTERVPGGPRSDAVFGILFVGTGNVCRSPLAERLGRAYLDELLGDEAAFLQLESAGTSAVVGERMHPFSALVLEGVGGDPDGFSARRLDGAQVDAADLVLTMTREHRRAALSVAPRSWAKTFTLREAADLARVAGRSAPPHGDDVVSRGHSLVEQIASVRGQRQSTAADDITDPIGRSVEVHQQVGEAVADSLVPILGRIAARHDRSPVQ